MHNELVTTNKERRKLHVAVFKAKRRHFTAAKQIDHSSSIERQLQQGFFSECLIAEVHLLVANNQMFFVRNRTGPSHARLDVLSLQ